MKTEHILTASILVLALAGNASSEKLKGEKSGANPDIPVGFLKVTPSRVYVGDHPDLQWKIRYPEKAKDIFTITPTKGIQVNKSVRIDLQIVGVAFDEDTQQSVTIFLNDGGSWQSVFTGRYDDVDPETPVYSKVVRAGTVINLASQSQSSSGDWNPSRTTTESDVAIAAVLDGDPVPDGVPRTIYGTLKDYLTKHISNNGHGNNADGVDVSNPGQGGGGPNGEEDTSVDADGNIIDDEIKIKLGSQEVIHLFELGTRDTSQPDFDMQDLVTVLSFSEVE